MKALYWIVGIVAGGLALILVIGAMLSTPESRARRERLEQIDAFCGKAMSDAALGSERRYTREMCDQLRERAQR